MRREHKALSGSGASQDEAKGRSAETWRLPHFPRCDYFPRVSCDECRRTLQRERPYRRVLTAHEQMNTGSNGRLRRQSRRRRHSRHPPIAPAAVSRLRGWQARWPQGRTLCLADGGLRITVGRWKVIEGEAPMVVERRMLDNSLLPAAACPSQIASNE